MEKPPSAYMVPLSSVGHSDGPVISGLYKGRWCESHQERATREM
jgi:hypothetical protein